jgi:hypothetical protein
MRRFVGASGICAVGPGASVCGRDRSRLADREYQVSTTLAKRSPSQRAKPTSETSDANILIHAHVS